MLIENPTGRYEGDRMPRDAATLVSWWKAGFLVTLVVQAHPPNRQRR